MSRRSDLAFSIWSEVERMLYSLQIDSDVYCVGESLGSVSKGGQLSRLGFVWVGRLTIDGQSYTVGSKASMLELGSRIIVLDKRDDHDKVVDFLVVPKPKRKVLTVAAQPD